MSNEGTEADAVAEIATQAMEVQVITDGVHGGYVPPGWILATLDTYAEGLEDGPRRKTGAGVVTDLDSLVAYINMQDETPAIYGNREAETFTAVFNDHVGEHAGYGDHKMMFQLTQTPDWANVNYLSRTMQGSVKFAELIEDLRTVIAEPPTVELIGFIREFKASRVTELEESIDPKSGDRSFRYKTKTTTSDVVVPDEFVFAVPVYEGTDPVALRADFQYRAPESEGKVVSFCYVVRDADRVRRAAFDGIAEQLKAALPEAVVMMGRPAAG